MILTGHIRCLSRVSTRQWSQNVFSEMFIILKQGTGYDAQYRVWMWLSCKWNVSVVYWKDKVLNTHTHTHASGRHQDNSLKILQGNGAIKHTVIFLPAASKHVTVFLCPPLGALSKYDRRSHLFSQGGCFNYRVAPSRATPVQMSVQSSPLMQTRFSSKKRKKKKNNLTFSWLLGSRILKYSILGHLHPSLPFLSLSSYLWQVMCATITHAHYHVSSTLPGVGTLISNILIAAGSYIFLCFATISGLWNNELEFGLG